MTDACIYVRISNDPDADTDDGGQGVARQEQDCRALADRLGWTVAHVFSDNDISAYNGKNRPGFEDMLAAVKHGRYDGVICWHTDRLTRSMKDLERVIDICAAADVPIRTVNGGDLDLATATGKMNFRIVSAVARQESEHKAERQRRANRQRAEAGGWWSSHRVFGYEQDGTVREPEAAQIRQAAADVLTGVSMRAIARRMNEQGCVTAAGKRWNGVNLKGMLLNVRYAGLRAYNGKVIGPGDWTAILEPDTHAGVVAVLSDPSRGPATVRYERKYIGSQRYRCGRCGAKMQHTISTESNAKVYHRYVCTAAAHLARSQPELDAYVEAVALEYMIGTEDLHKVIGTRVGDGHTVDPTELRTRRAALAAQKDDLATLFTDGVLDGPAVRRESAKLQQKIGTIDAALADLARRSPLGHVS